MKKTLTTIRLSLSMGICAQVIHNDVFWDTQDGTPLYSQGGGIFKFIDPETNEMAYFWYGSHFYEAEAYRKDPSVTIDRNTIKGVSCYKSTDLVHWKDMGQDWATTNGSLSPSTATALTSTRSRHGR